MDSRIARQAGKQFEALLLERMLAPLEQSFGEFGALALSACARSVAQCDAGGFASLVANVLERGHA
ncbi:MAG: hypothetical protein ACXVAS_11740 [Vulcanimicrobiaceae bacterium]